MTKIGYFLEFIASFSMLRQQLTKGFYFFHFFAGQGSSSFHFTTAVAAKFVCEVDSSKATYCMISIKFDFN